MTATETRPARLAAALAAAAVLLALAPAAPASAADATSPLRVTSAHVLKDAGRKGVLDGGDRIRVRFNRRVWAVSPDHPFVPLRDPNRWYRKGVVHVQVSGIECAHWHRNGSATWYAFADCKLSANRKALILTVVKAPSSNVAYPLVVANVSRLVDAKTRREPNYTKRAFLRSPHAK